ncbi:hypothetical protein JCM10213_000345 [Rhodosporidiobolus nylandii]
MATPLLTAQAAYKKQPGTLTLTPQAIAFTPTASPSPSPSVSIPCEVITALFASKSTAARSMLKIQFLPSAHPSPFLIPAGSTEDSHNFTFTSPTSALQDRDRFKDELSGVVARNRERDARAAASGGASGQGAPAGGQREEPRPTFKGAAAAAGAGVGVAAQDSGKGKGKERASDSPSSASAAASPSAAGGSPAPAPSSHSTGTSAPSSTSDFRLRQLVLQSDPSLLALHRSLVQSGALSELEFWSSPSRQTLLASFAAEEGLMRGKSGEMVDPKTVTGQNGEVTVKITPGLIREIFEEWPVVLRAYNENVPEPLSEPLFWTRYFQSRLFNRNRTTNRAAVSAIKDDPIFDRYLGEEDDGVEPQHEFDESAVGRLLDLKASEEDQHEAPTLPPDHTMRPGHQRASLPLMRRFNEHSERLLNQALGGREVGRGARERGYVDPGNAGDRNYYSAIELSDLSNPTLPERISLTLNERTSSATSAQAGAVADSEAAAEGEGEASFGERWERRKRERETVEGVVEGWEGRLGEFEVDAAAVRDAMRDMTSSISEQAERVRKTGGGGLSRQHNLTISSLSTTTYEFLRHFWSALLPPPASLPSSSTPSPSERAQKVEKFKGYLEKSLERVGVAEESARGEGEEMGRRVEAALRPVREAVEAALGEYGRRMAQPPAGAPGKRAGTPLRQTSTPAPGTPVAV